MHLNTKWNCTQVTAVEQLLPKLADVRKTKNGWLARCPAHDDGRASLSIAEGDDGRALVHCHAGCTVEAVCQRVGLRLADLMPERGLQHRNGEPQIVATYRYRDEAGELLSEVVRFKPKDFRQRKPKPGGGWEWSVRGVRVVPYRLPELLAEPTCAVIVVEGEKDCDNLAKIGVLATCNAGGARKWTAEHAAFLRGRAVVIIPDNDEAGRCHAGEVAMTLQHVADSVKVVELPGLPLKGDVSDWLAAGGTRDELLRLAEAAPTWTPAPAGVSCDDAAVSDEARQSQATMIAELAAGWELWHTAAGDAYATITVGEHHEHWPVRSKTFRRFLAKSFFDFTGKAANGEAIATALNLLEAQAAYDGAEHPVFVRVAEHGQNIFIDLGDAAWRAVEITPQGWRIVDDPPVRFRRTKGTLALPEPERGGSVDDLRRFVNVEGADWPLVVAWLVAALRPRGPYPVLALFATQGAGKSNMARFLRALIDPNAAPLRSESRDPRDLIISAVNSWCVSYDNLSHLPAWLSDALCRLSTGGGFATRELYSDSEEVIFDAQRPVILTSIVELAERSDLLDRCLPVGLPPIGDDRRRDEKTLLAEFEAARPRILGALFDGVAGALRNLKNVHLDRLPRMADFATWATAAEPALGWAPGTFVAAYTRNRAAANELALEASPIAGRLLELLSVAGRWEGTAAELLQALEGPFGSDTRRPPAWPKNARSLSGHLRRLTPNLLAAGWPVDFGRRADHGRARIVVITSATC